MKGPLSKSELMEDLLARAERRDPVLDRIIVVKFIVSLGIAYALYPGEGMLGAVGLALALAVAVGLVVGVGVAMVLGWR